MVGIVLISHGGMAEGMTTTAPMLWAEFSQTTSLTLWPQTNPDAFQEELEAKIAQVDTGDGVFVLADLAGGTPCNRALYSLIGGAHIKLLTGLNLPMLLTLLTEREDTNDLDALAEAALEGAHAGICDMGEKLKKRGQLT